MNLPVNKFKRLVYEGSELSCASTVSSYSFESPGDYTNTMTQSKCDTRWKCQVHGSGCMGHLESDQQGKYVLIPSTLIPSTKDHLNRYQRYKDELCKGHLDYETYKKLTSRIMMGKKGLVRSMSSLCVEGTIKMVISVGYNGDEGSVSIPSIIAENVLIPECVNGIVQYSHVNDLDMAILIRQPCLWSGGTQPVVVRVTPPIIMSCQEHHWDVNYTMRLPPDMCRPFGADFDGDEMTLFPLKDINSLSECGKFQWKYSTLSNEKIHSDLLPSRHPVHHGGFAAMYLRSTLCWSDTNRRDLKITHAHKMCGVTISSFIRFSKPHKNALEFASIALQNMSLGASKASLQSDIGALSRRCNAAAGTIFISSGGCPCIVSRMSRVVLAPCSVVSPLWCKYNFGNPTVRAMSKITSRIMQVTLKVKSTQSLNSYSPTLTLLSGSSSWPIITSEGSTLNSDSQNIRITGVLATSNLWHMSMMQNNSNLLEMCKACLCLCIAETGVVLDPAEFEYMVQLILLSVKRVTHCNEGLCVDTFKQYSHFPSIWCWSACYYNSNSTLEAMPQSTDCLYEKLLTCNFTNSVGILD